MASIASLILFFLVGFSKEIFGLTFRPFLSNKIAIGSTKLNVATSFMGSDSLERPDDENSPEFQVYLKQLLSMQTTRSKAGFAAPSSGSADAYIAKLSRMKIERNARVRAGLPDAPTNSGYLPIDYKAAILEAQEPLIRSSPIQEASGARIRAPSQEEMFALRLAQETVDKELAARNAAPTQKNLLSPEAVNAPIKTPATPQSNIVNAKTIPVKVIEPKKVAPTRVPPQSPPAPATAPPVATSKPPPVQTRPPAPVITAKPVVAANTQLPKKAPASNAVTRKLTNDEMQSIVDSVALLVKHRGGGPFGAGRLQGVETNELITTLQAAMAILEGDANYQSQSPSATATAPASHTRTQALGAVKSPQGSKPALSEDSPVRQVTPKATSLAPPSASPSSTTSTTTRSPLISTDMTSSSGSSTMTLEELVQMRDTLIRSLSAVQSRIDTLTSGNAIVQKEEAAAVNYSTNQVDLSSEEDSFQSNEVAAVASLPATTATATTPFTSSNRSTQNEPSTSAELQTELRKALGLLLKHRGGPGFGHGRLEREELTAMQNSLRKIARELYEEAVNAGTGEEEEEFGYDKNE